MKTKTIVIIVLVLFIAIGSFIYNQSQPQPTYTCRWDNDGAVWSGWENKPTLPPSKLGVNLYHVTCSEDED